MPALPAVASVVRMDFKFTIAAGAPAQFRRFFKYVGVLSQADAQTWVNAADAAWAARMLTDFANTETLNSVLLTDLTSNTAAQAIAATPHASTNGAAAVPNGVAVVIKDKIARRYRGGHPRTYLPAMVNTHLATPDTWDATFLAGLLVDWNNFISDILNAVPVAAAPATEVNVSYFSGFHNVTFPSGRIRAVPLQRVTPVVDTILGHSINPKVASQRRRNEQGV